jgi:hypothetical protein
VALYAAELGAMSMPTDGKAPHDTDPPKTDAERIPDDAAPLDEGDVVARVAAGELVPLIVDGTVPVRSGVLAQLRARAKTKGPKEPRKR